LKRTTETEACQGCKVWNKVKKMSVENNGPLATFFVSSVRAVTVTGMMNIAAAAVYER